jgi:serine/threonine-protein kinase
MSPEQVRGVAVHRRSDIWAFGYVLYEALAGKPPFLADTGSDTLAAILREEPDWSAFSGPQSLQRLVRRCLCKDLQSRLRDIADARLEIEELLQESAAMPAVAAAPRRSPRRLMAAMVAAAALVAAAGTFLAWRSLTVSPTERPATARVAIPLAPGQQLAVGPTPALALSADGRRLVYVAAEPGGRTQVHLRPLDRFEASAISGTQGASAPFFSPDGEWIGLYASDATQKISTHGGSPLKISDAPTLSSAAWLPDGTVVFSTTLAGDGLWRVSADGGTPDRLTEPDAAQKEVQHVHPFPLPGQQAVLFSIIAEDGVFGAFLPLDSLKWRRLPQTRASSGGMQYLASGHLIAAQPRVAIRFDPDAGEASRSPMPLAERIAASMMGTAAFALSQNGTLAYVPGRPALPRRTLVRPRRTRHSTQRCSCARRATPVFTEWAIARDDDRVGRRRGCLGSTISAVAPEFDWPPATPPGSPCGRPMACGSGSTPRASAHGISTRASPTRARRSSRL